MTGSGRLEVESRAYPLFTLKELDAPVDKLAGGEAIRPTLGRDPERAR